MKRKITEIKDFNSRSKVGASLVCPSCGTDFIKESYQQVFCKTKPKTVCKDKYWNTVDPSKRNNTTRISPASARWMRKNKKRYENDTFDHPFSSASHGQWDD